jgi:hypothetical protein
VAGRKKSHITTKSICKYTASAKASHINFTTGIIQTGSRDQLASFIQLEVKARNFKAAWRAPRKRNQNHD